MVDDADQVDEFGPEVAVKRTVIAPAFDGFVDWSNPPEYVAVCTNCHKVSCAVNMPDSVCQAQNAAMVLAEHWIKFGVRALR